MKIAVDVRSLHSEEFSGVEHYIVHLLEHALPLDRTNSYKLFYSGMATKSLDYLQFVNTSLIYRRISNRLLNISLKIFKRPRFETLTGEFDCLFLPNWAGFSIKPQTKLVVTIHDLSPIIAPEFYHLKSRAWHRFLSIPALLERAGILCAVSEYTKQDIIRNCGIGPDKIRVIYPGIDHSTFYPDLPEAHLRDVRNRYGLPGNFLLFLNTIEPRKNLTGAIRALERLPRPVPLVIAGKKGWKYKEIFREIHNSPRRRCIKYLGYVPAEDKPYILKLARALVYPSFYEGFGFQPVEAMAVGTPVIASNVTSLPEVIGSAGLLVDPYNSDDLAQAIESVLHDVSLREQLIRRGLARAKDFDWDRSARQLLSVFSELNISK